MLFFHKTFFTVLAALLIVVCVYAALPAGENSGGKTIEKVGIVDASALNMRSCPKTSCSIIRVLTRGEVIGITGKEGDWLEIRHQNTTGYVYGAGSYVRRDSGVVTKETDFAGVEDALEKAKEIEKWITHKKEDVTGMDRKAAEVVEALEDIDKKLSGVTENLKQVKKDSEEIEQRIEETGAEISRTLAAIEKNKDYAEKRLVALYKLNRLGGMNLLATADSTNDLFRRKAAMEAVLAHDEKIIRRLVDEKKHLADLYERAAEEKNRKEALENQYKRSQAALAETRNQRKRLLADIKAEKTTALTEIEFLEEAARRLDETINRLKQRAVERDAGEQKAFSEYQGLLKMPVDGKIISTYGKYTEPQSGAVRFRNGIELQAARGAPVRAVFDGEASFSDWIAGFGRVIIVSHGNSFYTVYGHLEELFAGEGDTVKANEVIATVGDSGSISGTVLYFEIRHKGNPLDPLDWIEKG